MTFAAASPTNGRTACVGQLSNANVKTAIAATSAPKTYFVVIGKGKLVDLRKQQERAVVAVRKVAERAKSVERETVVHAIAERVMTREEYRRGETKDKATGTVFRERLQQLATTAAPQDTVAIYTHSHGRKNGFEESQPLGGIVMDLAVRHSEHGDTVLWDEYVDLLLKLPAQNVVVLTMSCFSGSLVEYLDSPRVRERWKDRRRKEGRNLIVLTSQQKAADTLETIGVGSDVLDLRSLSP